MNRFTSTREAYDAYLRGSATLEEVSQAANRSIMEHLKRTGRRTDETANARSEQTSTEQ